MPGQRHSQPTPTLLGKECTGVFYVPLWLHGGGTDSEYESAHKVNSGEENPPAAPAGIRTRNLSITSPAFLPTSCPGSKYMTDKIIGYWTVTTSFVQFSGAL